MKKYSLFLLCIMFVSPAFAQADKVVEVVQPGSKAVIRGPDLARSVIDRILQASRISNLSWARIDNMAGTPLIAVRSLENSSTQPGNILSARLLKPGEVYHHINKDAVGKLNVPQSFAKDDGALYWGISVRDLFSLRHIFKKGMEIQKSKFPVIYSSYDLGVALRYIYPEEVVDKGLPTALSELPVMVKISLTGKMLKKNPPTRWMDKDILFGKDIKPQFISEIMTFLEINGQAGWYRVVWKNRKMIFVPVPSTLVAQSIDY